MDVGKAGWLTALVHEVVEAHARVPAPAPEGGGRPGRAAARAHLKRVLRESGLLYGTPTASASGAGGTGSGSGGVPGAPPRGAREDILFLAVMRVLCRLGLELAALCGAPRGPRAQQLLLLFAAHTGCWDELEEVQEVLETGLPSPMRRAWAKVEEALEARAVSLSGDPVYGLVLHNGAVYADAHVFGRQAIAYFSRGGLSPRTARRRSELGARQKALLVEVLTALACAERPPPFSSRRAILRQVEDLGLPGVLQSELRAKVKRAFDGRRPLVELAEKVRSRDMKRFILEQALLASLVDGHRSAKELAFLRTLAGAFGVSAAELSGLEREVAEFYRRNRQVVDVFTVSTAASVVDEELLGSVQSSLERTYRRLMQELRETGELSVLLAKVARGQSVTAEERRRMRAQLIDLAKAVPALAIFAAPGGVLLLIALAKVLPFSLLPSAFQEAADTDPGLAGAGELPSEGITEEFALAEVDPDLAAEADAEPGPSRAEVGPGGRRRG